jgi:hypothetical protein
MDAALILQPHNRALWCRHCHCSPSWHNSLHRSGGQKPVEASDLIVGRPASHVRRTRRTPGRAVPLKSNFAAARCRELMVSQVWANAHSVFDSGYMLLSASEIMNTKKVPTG